MHNCPRGSIAILRWLRKWELERGGSQACRKFSLVSPVWGVCTCCIHNGLRAPFTQEYVPHTHRRMCPMHTRVRAPFTHAYPPLSHRRTCPIHTSVRIAPFTLGGRARQSRFSLTPGSSQGSFRKGPRSRPPLPRLPTQYPSHPAWRLDIPHLPSQLSHSYRTHPSAHLYSPPTVVLIPLSRVCTGSFVYVLLLLSCVVNVHSLAVLRVVSRAYLPCMQGSSQMVRSTRSTARRGASNKDPPPQVCKRN